VEVFLPDLPSLSLTHWALRHIGIHEEYAPWWNVETDTSSWEPKNMMHTNTFWVLSPGVARQGFTAAIMAWVEPPWDSSHLSLVPRIQQRSFGCVNKHVDFIGHFREIPWGRAHSPLVTFVLYYIPFFVRSLKPKSDDGMTHLPKCERHSGFGTKLNICVGCEGYITPGNRYNLFLLRKIGYELDGDPF
jgi:hypothetical protein